MSSTGMSLAILEKNLPQERVGALVEALDMSKQRFLATAMLACERNPRLMDYPVQQHVAWISGAAALGLEPDGLTGQAFPIPFGGKRPCVQLVIGYRGFLSMAGRAGITINSGTLIEGDEWPGVLRAGEPFQVKQRFGDRNSAKLVGAWSQAQLPNGQFTMPLLMDMSEILAVKAKSPGARKNDSPWNDAAVGFPAMAQKTAVRRLQRTLPSLITPGRTWSTHAVGAQADMLHEEVGHATSVDLEGNLHDHGAITVEAEDVLDPHIELPNGNKVGGTWGNMEGVAKKIRISAVAVVSQIQNLNKARLANWTASDNAEARAAADAINMAIDAVLSGGAQGDG